MRAPAPAALNRRHLLGLLASSALPLPASAASTPTTGNPALRAMLQQVFDAILARSPETATTLGLDKAANAALASRLSDLTPAGDAADAAVEARARTLLATVPRPGLGIGDGAAWDSLAFALETAKTGRSFGYGQAGLSGGVPYIVSHQGGTYSQAAEFLDSYHRVEDAAGAEAYMARLAQVGGNLDAETERLGADAGKGVVPPDFMLANILGQQDAMLAIAPAASGFVTSIARRAKALGLPDPTARATEIVAKQIMPALARQRAALAALPGSSDAGAWKLPQGEAYYGWQLRTMTTTSQTPAEIHATGLEQVREIDAKMDAIFRAQGMTQGTVGERTAALTADKRFIKPDSDAGRAEVLAAVAGHLKRLKALTPQLSRLGLACPVEAKRVPVAIQDGASLGYMQFAATDGSRPAIYYINLKSMDYWPDWTLASLSAHEGIPGHAWQGAWLAEHPDQVAPTAQIIGFNAFVEGWALYAEQLVDEAGYYENDPFGRIGYLQAQKFRAVRLIVDTGLHHLRWSRDKAIDVMVSNTGRARAAAQSEIDRYCASPGQACGYKVGHNEILRQRERARAALGSRFDVKDFNDALVMTGGVPLTSLPAIVDALVARARSA
jgi:uncharacterized protein (DUF885 family)